MKIEFFIESYYCGGVDTFIINLVNNWPNKRDEIIVVCNADHAGLPSIQKKITRPCVFIGHKIKTFQSFFNKTKKTSVANSVIPGILKITSPLTRYFFLIYNILLLKKILFKNKPDRLVIVNGGYPGGDACRAASIAWGIFSKKKRSIHTVHGIAVKPGWHIAFQEFIVNSLVSLFTEYFVVVSHAVGRCLMEIKGIEKNKFCCIYNGITFSDVSVDVDVRKKIKIENGIPQNAYFCLTLGAYHRHKNFDKGHDFLIKTFKLVVDQVPNAHLLICGYGQQEDMERVRLMVKDASLERHVHLDNFRSDISEILKGTDLLLISAQTFESFSLTSIEAWANKIPVVTTDVGGIPEVVKNGQGGYCLSKDDMRSYARHVVMLLTDEKLRQEQGHKGYQRYRDFFTANRMACEYESLLKT